MVMFDDIEEIFKSVRDFSEYSRAIVTLATATGSLIILFYTIKLLFHLLVGFRLYVLSQFCCRAADYSKKYGQWAVISGSTDGIGLSMAKELAKRGHSIVVIGRNEEKLAKTKATLDQEPNVGEVITVKIDLSDPSPQNFERIRLEIDPDNRDIGILINNAGVFTSTCGRFASFDMDDIRNTVNVNVIATLYFTKMILPGMLKRKRGLILNVSSILGFVPAPYFHVYGATKAFMNSFSSSLQMEYSSYPIDIINLTPGAVHTKLFTAIAGNSKQPSPINPTPDEYARTALNAVATRIKFISGTMVHGLFKIFSFAGDSLGLTHIGMKFAMYVQGMKMLPDEVELPSSQQEIAT